ncbi:hypothetical protein C8R43DRAFT_315739 [Mycena crocata]|nr:hypothetical protein C8R43DRAFT_315739 [Mycena crocata]
MYRTILYRSFLICASPPAILSKCSRTQDICFLSPGHSALLLLLAAMAPRSVYVSSVPDLFYPARVDYSHPLFARATHLELDHIDFPAVLADLAALPCLTHLAVDNLPSHEVDSVLLNWARLTVLVLLCFYDGEVDQEISASFADEKRLVQFAVADFDEDWEAGAVGREDYWSRADAIVRQRHSTAENKSAAR